MYFLQETHATSNSENMWRQEWGGPAFFSNGTRNSRRVAILMNRDLSFRVLNSKSDREGRLICMDVGMKGGVYTIGTLYAPTRDKGKEQLEFIDMVDGILTELRGINIIMGGDLNNCINPTLERNSTTALPSSAETVGHRLSILLDGWGLCDVWRARNPTRIHLQEKILRSRLDYIFTSAHLGLPEAVQNTDVQTLPHSDHALLVVSLGAATDTRGPVLWRLDTSILEREDSVSNMLEFLSTWEAPRELTNPASVWEWLKFEIQTFTIKYSRKAHAEMKQHTANLNKRMKDL